MSHGTRSLLLTVLAVVILGVTGAALRSWRTVAPVLLAVPAPDCDLRLGPCTARFADGGEVTLEVEPRGIPVARPLTFRLTTRGLTADTVALDLVAVDMDMGYNRPSLVPAGPGVYRGQGMLPVCVRRRMTWEARVLLTTRGGLVAAPFRFDTGR